MILSACNQNSTASESIKDVKLSPFSTEILQDSIQAEPKLTLVNFYATWCRPCVREIPDLLELQNQFPNKLRLMMVSIDDAQVIENKLPDFLVDKNITLPTWYLAGDLPQTAQTIFGLYPQWGQSIPLSLLFNSKGELIQAYTGQINPEELRKILHTQSL
jgi:thiol-disulfide isomerase/thioredoxin